MTKVWARIRRWWKVMKGPPPRKHGVIPPDYEKRDLPASQRPYLNDLSMSLRPADHDYALKPAVQLKPIPKHKLMWESNYDRVGWAKNSLENANEQAD